MRLCEIDLVWHNNQTERKIQCVAKLRFAYCDCKWHVYSPLTLTVNCLWIWTLWQWMVQLKQIAICCSCWNPSHEEATHTYHCFYIDCVRQELSKWDPSESSDGSREFLFVSLRAKFYFSAWSCSDFDLPLFLDELLFLLNKVRCGNATFNPYPTAFPYGNGMVLHFYQQQESSTTKTVHKVINKGLKTYV